MGGGVKKHPVLTRQVKPGSVWTHWKALSCLVNPSSQREGVNMIPRAVATTGIGYTLLVGVLEGLRWLAKRLWPQEVTKHDIAKCTSQK